jgi:hypothetical protein
MQRCGVERPFDAAQAPPAIAAVGQRTDASCEGARQDVEPDDIMPGAAQGSHQRLAEMTGTSRHQDLHCG